MFDNSENLVFGKKCYTWMMLFSLQAFPKYWPGNGPRLFVVIHTRLHKKQNHPQCCRPIAIKEIRIKIWTHFLIPYGRSIYKQNLILLHTLNCGGKHEKKHRKHTEKKIKKARAEFSRVGKIYMKILLFCAEFSDAFYRVIILRWEYLEMMIISCP